MGEQACYEQMAQEMEETERQIVQMRLAEAAARQREKLESFATADTGLFQMGSPFKFKDIVLHNPTKREGKVVGLPLQYKGGGTSGPSTVAS